MMEAEEKLKIELQIELEHMFPNVQNDMDNNFLEMQQEMVNFVIFVQKGELYSYLESRDESKCVFKHFSEFPLGVAFIEKWIHGKDLDKYISQSNLSESDEKN
jgi:hypothetical protein